jgi:hypothetical protein
MSWIRNTDLNYKVPHQQLFELVLRIRTGFNEDPEQAFMRIRIQGFKTNADPDPGQTLPLKSSIFT